VTGGSGSETTGTAPRLSWIGDAQGRGSIAEGPALSPYDRGFLHGLGLFETVRAATGSDGVARLPLWDRHLARLAAGARRLDLPAPSAAGLGAAALELLGRQGVADGILRLTLTAGVDAPQCCLTTRPRVDLGRPVRLAVVAARRDPSDPTARLKTTSRLFWELAQREARTRGADEAVVLSPDGAVLETATGNVFCSLDGRVRTPGPDGPFLPGVARAALLDALRAAGRPAVEGRLALGDLQRAEALWVTNAVHGPRPAVLVHPPALPGGPPGTPGPPGTLGPPEPPADPLGPLWREVLRR
jgi:branched-subunit amino acid aminotransferase/4-amino-4-deoxychorismate lyase